MNKKLLPLVVACALGGSVPAFAQSSSSASAPDGGMDYGSQQMHESMMSGMQKMQGMQPTGDTDKDFAMMMRAHHQQAVDMAKVEALWGAILAEGREIAARHGAALDYVRRYASSPALTDPSLRAAIAESARGLGLATLELPSGAGHDAQELAKIAPVGMIFVPSVGGISHSPRELTRPQDVENGANVLLRTLLRLDRS